MRSDLHTLRRFAQWREWHRGHHPRAPGRCCRAVVGPIAELGLGIRAAAAMLAAPERGPGGR